MTEEDVFVRWCQAVIDARGDDQLKGGANDPRNLSEDEDEPRSAEPRYIDLPGMVSYAEASAWLGESPETFILRAAGLQVEPPWDVNGPWLEPIFWDAVKAIAVGQLQSTPED